MLDPDGPDNVEMQRSMSKAENGNTQVSRPDGGSGHSGERSFEVFFGLGNTSDAVAAEISWRDTNGRTHTQKLDPEAGMHHIPLGTRPPRW